MNNNQNQIGGDNRPANRQSNNSLNQFEPNHSQIHIAYIAKQNQIDRDKKLANIERITWLMDSQFSILGFRFGLDPLVNFVPFLGAAVSAIISALLVSAMAKHGVSDKVKAKMFVNVALDWLIGTIPVLGWVFDFYYKANRRNFILLKEHYQEGKHQGGAGSVFGPIAIGMVALVVFICFLVWQLIGWILG